MHAHHRLARLTTMNIAPIVRFSGRTDLSRIEKLATVLGTLAWQSGFETYDDRGRRLREITITSGSPMSARIRALVRRTDYAARSPCVTSRQRMEAMVQRVERSRGTVVHTYLGQPGSKAQDDRDAVLVRSSAAAYMADANSWQLGRIAACDFRDPADVVVTPWQPVRRTGLFYLGLQLDGRGSLTQRSSDGAERTVELAPGRMVVYARNRPFRLSLTGPYHYLVLELVPAELGLDERRLLLAAANEELGSTPSACLLAGLLGELPDQLSRLSAPARLETADVVTTLLAGGLRSLCDASPVADRLFDEVLSWIEEHLSDPDLDPDAIAAAHHISTRYLHKVFSRHDVTVAGYVRARRLELVRRDLGDPAKANEPVSAVARRRGIVDPSYLSKAFRSRFRVSPREYRAQQIEG